MEFLTSIDLINQYDEVSKKFKESKEPLCLIKKGTPDLVIMSIDTYEKYQAHPKLKERFLDI